MTDRTINTKSEFLDLAARGILGNQMPSWPSTEAARQSGYSGPVMIRDRTPNSPFMRAYVPMDDVPAIIVGLVELGARRETLYLTHMTAGVGRRLNGELWMGPTGLYLNYATVQTHLRAALDRAGRHVERSAAMAVLRWGCDPDSVDDLMLLLEKYPDACVEFTAYDREIGTIPHRNTIVWECRNY